MTRYVPDRGRFSRAGRELYGHTVGGLRPRRPGRTRWS
ncbi:hypothetical protein STRTUCAR8_08179 [Streptomyces turgidiscabies Car8]|uniref:Uncharacterized protein n=1 Tax=Streptomyces turgidiscabies (strain Car8) TaxID=698760 RepID=L7F639_STRT8|nr:hypothetical protein STRTUCAR8_08179 [Streptomyces turgidiscabies Car8]